MKKTTEGHITAFYIEALLLVITFVAIILVLSKVFSASLKRSQEAVTLTTAVALSQKAAEAFSYGKTPEKTAEVLNDGGNVVWDAASQKVIGTYAKEGTPDPNGPLRLEMTFEEEQDDQDLLRICQISVTDETGKLIYSLSEAVYLKEVAP